MAEFIGISEFCDAVRQTTPVMLLGAGISLAAPSGLPLATDLINSFYKALTSDPQMAALVNELPADALNTLRSPELIYNAVSEYAAQIVPQLFRAALDSDLPNVNHWIAAQLLAQGTVERIITTNFDQLIERCLCAEVCSVRLQDDAPQDKPEVWKIHGDLRRHMAIALNDVSILGFSPVPALLAESLVGKCVIVAGYSGNDLHVLRAIIDGRPDRVWWVVRPGEIPGAVNIVSQNVASLAVVEGDLSRQDIGNPLIALWRLIGRRSIPHNVVAANTARANTTLEKRLGEVLSGLHAGQKGFVLHSLLRRAGTKTTLAYRKKLFILLHEAMFKVDGCSDSLGYAIGKDKDSLESYEKLFTPHIAARQTLLRRYHIEPHETEGFTGWDDSQLGSGKGLNWREEAEVLLEVGLENAFRGNFERSKLVLEAALECAKGKGLRVLQMRSAEALGWVYLQLGQSSISDHYHSIYSQYIKNVIRDICVLRDCAEQLDYQNLLVGLNPPDEPKLYGVLALDRRYRSFVQCIRLAGRLRYIGKPDLGIEVIDRVRINSEGGSLYVHALNGFQKLEKAQCLFSLCKVQEGLELIEAAEEALKVIEDRDYEVLRQFYRIIQKYYVSSGRMGRMITAMLDALRVL